MNDSSLHCRRVLTINEAILTETSYEYMTKKPFMRYILSKKFKLLTDMEGYS